MDQYRGSVFDDIAVDNSKDDIAEEAVDASHFLVRSPVHKTRAYSDSGGRTPGRLLPSPHIWELSIQKRQSKDDSLLPERDRDINFPPSTPSRTGFSVRSLDLQMPPLELASPAQAPSNSPFIQSAPLSPKLDQSHVYASSTHSIPRRSRGIDFSRAATCLHHSTLADHTSPEASPTISTRAMNIPGRRPGDANAHDPNSHSIWSAIGHSEKMHVSSSLGSTAHMGSDTSSSCDNNDLMDEDTDEAYVTTPQIAKINKGMAAGGLGLHSGVSSPGFNNLTSFQQRQRQRKQAKKKTVGALGLGFQLSAMQSAVSKSPPSNMAGPKEMPSSQSKRECTNWAANQLHLSGSESDDNLKTQREGVDSPSRPGVIRRAVTRRGNLLPKTKGFARIRAALAEESAPIDAEVRREAEVVRQVRESDMDLEIRPHPSDQASLPSPGFGVMPDGGNALGMTLSLEDPPVEDATMVDPMTPRGSGASGNNFKNQALKNYRGPGRVFWNTFAGSSPGGSRVTPPPPSFGLPRSSSCGLSLEDVNMDSPLAMSAAILTLGSGHGTPPTQGGLGNAASASAGPGGQAGGGIIFGQPPSVAEITLRISGKRRRDDDLDTMSLKRRAVSPGMSAHNSPVMQSPMQRDMWSGPAAASCSRPGSVGGDSVSKAPSESGGGGSQGGRPLSMGGPTPKGRVGYQGMVDTNEGITRLSIE